MSTSTMATAAGHRLASVSMSTDFDSVKYTRTINGTEFEIPASVIQLSLHGEGLSNLGTIFFKFIMEMLWTAYQACVWIVAWFANFAMELGWLNAIRGPFVAIQNVLQDLLRTYNLYATMLVITAFICVIWMARGRWGQGIAELFVALVITNYAIASIGGTPTDSTPVASYSPIDIMLGGDEDEGLIYQARNLGVEVVGDLDGEMEGDESFDPVTPGESIVKSFLWFPVQLVNFGEVLSPECQDAYALFMWARGQGKGEDDGGWLRDRMDEHLDSGTAGRAKDGVGDHVYYDEEGYSIPGTCMHDDENYYENQANVEGILTQWFLGPSVGFLGLLVIVIAGAVILAGINAVIQCFKVLFALLMAILPRGGRRSLWVTIGSAATALLILVFAIVFLGTFLVIIQQIFITQSGNSFGQRIGTFLLIDVLLIVGLIIFWRGRKSVSASKEKLANALANITPQGGGGGGGGAGAFGAGAAAGGGLAHAASRLHLAADVQRDFAGGKHMHDLVGKRRRAAGGGGGLATAAGGAAAKGGIGRLAKAGVGKGIKTAALGFATGGSSLLAQGGMMAAKSGALKAGAKMAGRTVRSGAQHGAARLHQARAAIHKARGNAAGVNRANIGRRRAEAAAQASRHQRKVRNHDRVTRATDFGARLTNGRMGTARRLQNRPAKRKDLVRDLRRDRHADKQAGKAANRREQSRLTAAEVARNNKVAKKLKDRDERRYARQLRRRENDQARRDQGLI